MNSEPSMKHGAVRDSVMLELRGLGVGVGERALIRDVDLRLEPGESVALRGPSGCGKTTLLRAVSGLVDPVAGEVLFRGQRPADVGWPRFRRQVTLVEQRPVMLNASVTANLVRPFRYGVADEAFPEERAAALLERVGLAPAVTTQNARALSGGEQQRVSLVRALLTGPAVLLLDEPTTSLDEAAVSAVEELLREEAGARGLAALVVTHDNVQADRWCDRTFDLVPYLTGTPSSAPGGAAHDSEGVP